MKYLFLFWLFCLNMGAFAQSIAEHGVVATVGIIGNLYADERNAGDPVYELGYGARIPLTAHMWLGGDVRLRTYDRAYTFIRGAQGSVASTASTRSWLEREHNIRIQHQEVSLPLLLGIHPSDRLPLTVTMGLALQYTLRSRVRGTITTVRNTVETTTFNAPVRQTPIGTEQLAARQLAGRNRAILPVGVSYRWGRYEFGLTYQAGRVKIRRFADHPFYRYRALLFTGRYRLSAPAASSLELF